MTRTTTRHSSTATAAREGTAPAAAWEGIERPPAKRWWWFIGFGYAVLLLAFCLLALSAWTPLALLVATTLAVVAVYRGDPRQVRATLTAKTLTINGQTFRLGDYRQARVEPPGEARCVVFVPRRPWRLRVVVPLTGNAGRDERIIEAIAGRLDAVDADPNLIDHLVRWTRLG